MFNRLKYCNASLLIYREFFKKIKKIIIFMIYIVSFHLDTKTLFSL